VKADLQVRRHSPGTEFLLRIPDRRTAE